MTAEPEIVGAPMPRIAGIEPSAAFSLHISWAEGERAGRTDLVDLSPQILRYRVYAPLRSGTVPFGSAHLIDEGTAIAWTDQIDMAATTIEWLAQQSMNNDEFRAFMNRHHLTYDGTAALLGIGRRLVAYYAADKPVPRLVALACAGVDAGATAASGR